MTEDRPTRSQSARLRPLTRVVVGVALLVAGVVVLPSVALAEVPVSVVERVQLTLDDSGRAGQTDVPGFEMAGATWSGPGTLEVRVHDDAGWTTWEVLEMTPEEGPDPVTGEPAPGSTEPLWVDDADGFEVRAAGDVRSLAMHLVRSETRVEVQEAAVASAAPPPVARWFEVRSRAEWGARPPKATPVYSPLKAAVIHHTVNSNDYTAGDVPAMLRSIQAYHMDANGWDDIAYNILVDRFGRVWEGRAGGIDQPVIGGHTMGFNTGTVGVSVIGDFTSSEPPSATVSAVIDVVAWKLGMAGVDPTATTVLTNRAPSHPRYAQGEEVRLPTVFGHRDTSPTGCPGARLFARIPSIRDEAARRVPYVLGSVDGAAAAPGGLRVKGWTIARGTTAPLDVHVVVDGTLTAIGRADAVRPDIDAAFPTYGPSHGYDLRLSVAPGARTVCVYGINNGDGRNYLIGCRGATAGGSPVGTLDGASRVPGGLAVQGWSLDPDTADPIAVDLYAGGQMLGRVRADASRPDIHAAYPDYGPAHGYAVEVPAPSASGSTSVCAFSINVGSGGSNPSLGCRTVRVLHDPYGSLDQVSGAQVRGWALDEDVASAIAVDVYVDGVWSARQLADASRPDVGASFSRWGANHGFAVTLGFTPTPGARVCAYALNASTGTSNSSLGCRSA